MFFDFFTNDYSLLFASIFRPSPTEKRIDMIRTSAFILYSMCMPTNFFLFHEFRFFLLSLCFWSIFRFLVLIYAYARMTCSESFVSLDVNKEMKPITCTSSKELYASPLLPQGLYIMNNTISGTPKEGSPYVEYLIIDDFDAFPIVIGGI